MSVTNLSVPARNVGLVKINSMIYGLEPEILEDESDDVIVYVDLYGNEDKARMVAALTDSCVIDQTVSVPGDPEGVGVTNELAEIDNRSQREANYGALMQPSFR